MLNCLGAFILRKKAPIISFSIAWFFAGHLIESTVLPLELYFEHRNYLPLFGIGFAFAWYAIKLIKVQKIATLVVVSLFLSLNGFIVYQNATLWGKPLELVTSWYTNHPESERARQSYLMLTRTTAIKSKLLASAEKQKKGGNKNDSMFYSGTVMYELAYACSNNKADKRMLEHTIETLKHNMIHAAVSTKTMDFLAYWKAGRCPIIKSKDIESFLLDLASLEGMKHNGIFLHDIYFQLSFLSMNKKDFNQTMFYVDKAYSYYPNIETLKLRFGYLLSAGLYEEALKVLDDSLQLKTNIRQQLAMIIKQKELDQLKQLVQRKIEEDKVKKLAVQ